MTDYSAYDANGNKNGGGIAWNSGSLVGSQNPDNLGFRYSNPMKRFRIAGDDGSDGKKSKIDLPSNLVVQFRNREGEELSVPLDLPTNSTVDDLNALVHTLMNGENDDDENDNEGKRVPYAFYAKVPRSAAQSKDDEVNCDDVEVTFSIEALLLQNEGKLSAEGVLKLTYQPLSVFRVRPVSRCTDTMTGHTEAVLHVSYSPDGKHLASGGGDTIVRFWDVRTSLPRFPPTKHHKNHVLCTAWSPDGKKFASADKNGVLIIWDPNTGHPVGYTKVKKPKKNSTVNDKDKKNDAEGGDSADKKTTALTKSTTIGGSVGGGGIIIKAHRQYITGIAWEPMHCNRDCDRLITSSKDGGAKIWNIRTRRCVVSLSGHLDSVESVKWGGEYLIYTASRDRMIKVWNAENNSNCGKLVKTLKGHSHRINCIALSSDYVCRTGPFDYDLQVKGRNKQQAGENEDDYNYRIACERYKHYKTTQTDSTGNKAVGDRLVSGSDDYTLFVWHPQQSKQPIKRLTGHQNLINDIAFSPDGRYFASASFDKKIKVWNGFSGEFILTLTGHVGPVYKISWSPDSRFLVSASKDSTAKLWTIPSGKKAKNTLPGHADEVYALDWSPGGSINSVATGSKDRTIKIWKH